MGVMRSYMLAKAAAKRLKGDWQRKLALLGFEEDPRKGERRKGERRVNQFNSEGLERRINESPEQETPEKRLWDAEKRLWDAEKRLRELERELKGMRQARSKEHARRNMAERILRRLAKPAQRMEPKEHQVWVRSVIGEYFGGDLQGAFRKSGHPHITGACPHCDINLYNNVPHAKAMPCNIPQCPYEKEPAQSSDKVLLFAAAGEDC